MVVQPEMKVSVLPPTPEREPEIPGNDSRPVLHAVVEVGGPQAGGPRFDDFELRPPFPLREERDARLPSGPQGRDKNGC
jgi:hypothetical protein